MTSKFGQMWPLVSMATDRVTVRKRRHHVFSNVFDQIHSILADHNDIHKSFNELKKTGAIRPWTTELTALECLKKSHRLIMRKMTSLHFLI